MFDQLRPALLANATFSAICAVELLLFPSVIGQWMGDVSPLLLSTVGWMLSAFVALLLFVASRPQPPLAIAQLITWSDWGWVAATPLAMLFGASYLNPIGHLMLIAVAMAVATCAVWQGKGLKQLASAT